jgi:hypothetical protein
MLRTFRVLVLSFKERAKFYHFHDPERLPAGLILKIFSNAKVLYDVHEDVFMQILDKQWLGSLFMRKLVANLYNLLERFSVYFIDYVVFSTEHIKKKYKSSRTIAIRNLPIIRFIDSCRKINIKK